MNTEFDNIATAVATKANLAAPTFTGTTTAANLTVSGTFTGTIDGGTYLCHMKQDIHFQICLGAWNSTAGLIGAIGQGVLTERGIKDIGQARQEAASFDRRTRLPSDRGWFDGSGAEGRTIQAFYCNYPNRG